MGELTQLSVTLTEREMERERVILERKYGGFVDQRKLAEVNVALKD
jgi:hypothetical protein